MIESAASNYYARVAALRQEAWEVLADYRQQRTDAQDARVVVGLQDVANRLGSIEEALLESSSDLDPAPCIATLDVPPLGLGGAGRAEADLPISAEAAIPLSLAEVSVPLAGSRTDEAERWLRVMRDHGYVGAALQELGMPSGQLSTPSLGPPRSGSAGVSPVTIVASEAGRLAVERGAPAISTIDVLFAVMAKYGPIFDRALYAATGKSRSALLATLAHRAAAQPA